VDQVLSRADSLHASWLSVFTEAGRFLSFDLALSPSHGGSVAELDSRKQMEGYFGRDFQGQQKVARGGNRHPGYESRMSPM